jgi:hypothetical protein
MMKYLLNFVAVTRLLLKLLLIGNSGVGKSCLLLQIADGFLSMCHIIHLLFPCISLLASLEMHTIFGCYCQQSCLMVATMFLLSNLIFLCSLFFMCSWCVFHGWCSVQHDSYLES